SSRELLRDGRPEELRELRRAVELGYYFSVNSQSRKATEAKKSAKKGHSEFGLWLSPFIELLDKPRCFQLLNQTDIDAAFRVGGCSFRCARGDVVEERLDAFGVRIGNLGERAVVGAVGALQSFRVVGLQILSDQCFGFFLVGLDEM